MNESPQGNGRLSVAQALALLGCLALYALVRLPWVGHLLAGDEATMLLSVRAFAAGGRDLFSSWFWRHPPALSALLLALSPFRAGFAERAEIALVLVGALSMWVLFSLNRRLFGVWPALWASFFLAVMPGAIFFDVWVKQEPLLTLFGLLSLYFFLSRREALSGLFLGLAFLTKTLAMFYVVTIFLLWAVRPRAARRWRDLGTVILLAAACSAWWHLFLSTSFMHVVDFVVGAPAGDEVAWVRPWHYFFEKIHVDLGFAGLALCLLGVAALYVVCRAIRAGRWAAWRADNAFGVVWPLAFLIPAFTVITLTRGKTPWFTVTLFPALATLQGVGAHGLLVFLRRAVLQGSPPLLRRAAGWAAAGLLIGVGLYNASDRNYEAVMRKQYYWMWWGASNSREAALMLNRLAGEGDRAMITPMYYWYTSTPRPCSVFTYYLEDIPVVIENFDAPFEDVLDNITRYRLDWVMMSPVPGGGEQAALVPLCRRYGLRPVVLRGACILRTTSIYKQDERGRE